MAVDPVDELEERLFKAAKRAMRAFLDRARRAVLHHETVTADAAPEDLPPNLDAWPDDSVWRELLAAELLPIMDAAWGEAFRQQTAGADLNPDAYREAFLRDVSDRLSLNLWPAGVFEEVRYELQEGMDAGETDAQLRDRVGRVLNIDAPSRQIRGRINRNRREGKPVPSSWWRGLDEADRQWWWMARRISRTEAMTSTNGGRYDAGRALQAVLGEPLYKQWWATPDSRVRDAHWHAHMQVQPYEQPFIVGGEPLDHPGDPAGTGGNTINCRCVLRVLNADEAAEQAKLHAQFLPGRTDIEGNPLVAAPADAPPDETTGSPVDQPDEQPTEPEAEPAPVGYWEGPLVPLDAESGDGRMIGSLPAYTATNHPWLTYQHQSQPGHDGKIGVGRVEKLWPAPADLDGQPVMHLWGAGTFDIGDPNAPEVMRKLAGGYAGTVSVELEGESTVKWVDENGADVPEPDPEDDELWDALFMGDDIGIRPIEYVTDWRFAGVTMVLDPAFHTGWIQLAETPTDVDPVWVNDLTDEPEETAMTVTAAAGTDSWYTQVANAVSELPDPACFAKPELGELTKVHVVNDQGWVAGYIADWNSVHASIPDQRPPRCPDGGALPRFHHNSVRCSDGQRVMTGALSSNGHAPTDRITMAAAQAHYDRPETVIADVVAGEDERGIWVAGTLRHGATSFQVRLLDVYSFSGDWRDGGYLIAACATGNPAFDVPPPMAQLLAAAKPDGHRLASSRTRLRRDADGHVAALVASGIVRPGHRPSRRRPRTAPPSGWDLYRQFKQAEKTDRRITAAHRRIVGPRVAAAAARVNGAN